MSTQGWIECYCSAVGLSYLVLHRRGVRGPVLEGGFAREQRLDAGGEGAVGTVRVGLVVQVAGLELLLVRSANLVMPCTAVFFSASLRSSTFFKFVRKTSKRWASSSAVAYTLPCSALNCSKRYFCVDSLAEYRVAEAEAMRARARVIFIVVQEF